MDSNRFDRYMAFVYWGLKMKQLILAEKPSVGRDIVNAIGGQFEKRMGIMKIVSILLVGPSGIWLNYVNQRIINLT